MDPVSEPARLLSLAAAGSAVGAILASYRRGGRPFFLVLKPLTTALLLAVALASGGGLGSRYTVLIAAGLLSALLGDILLMFPERGFIWGILSFSLTHALYFGAFATLSGIALAHGATPFVAAAAAGMLYLIWGGPPRLLRGPVVLYALLIAGMAAQAVGTAIARPAPGSALAAAGALLFFLSDAVLAIDRFRAAFPSARALVLSSYWLGQGMIALSTGLL